MRQDPFLHPKQDSKVLYVDKHKLSQAAYEAILLHATCKVDTIEGYNNSFEFMRDRDNAENWNIYSIQEIDSHVPVNTPEEVVSELVWLEELAAQYGGWWIRFDY